MEHRTNESTDKQAALDERLKRLEEQLRHIRQLLSLPNPEPVIE